MKLLLIAFAGILVALPALAWRDVTPDERASIESDWLGRAAALAGRNAALGITSSFRGHGRPRLVLPTNG